MPSHVELNFSTILDRLLSQLVPPKQENSDHDSNESRICFKSDFDVPIFFGWVLCQLGSILAFKLEQNLSKNRPQEALSLLIDFYIDFGGFGSGIGHMDTQFAINKILLCGQAPLQHGMNRSGDLPPP